MENPRTIPGEWAPPPPIISTPPTQKETPPPLRPEDEFEATLGSLVEHFNTLPPPAFGEAPELVAAPARDARARKRRSPALMWAGSLVLGGTIAGGVMLGLHLAKPAIVPESVQPAVLPAAPPPQVKIVVKSLPDEPSVAPVAEQSAPAVEPIADSASAVPAVAEHAATEQAAKPQPSKRIRKATVRKRAPSRPATPASPRLPASTGTDGWEDPYK